MTYVMPFTAFENSNWFKNYELGKIHYFLAKNESAAFAYNEI